MADTDLMAEVKKIKFQIRLLGETIDSDENPIPSLVIEMDWSEEDLETVHDIFEKASKLLQKGQEPEFGQFEHELKERFQITYQGIKPIVLAFYDSSQWIDVCEWYVKEQEPTVPMEFHEIAERIRQRAKSKKSK